MIFFKLLLPVLLLSSISFASSPKTLDLITYSEFSSLDDSQKNQYIKELRKIVNQLDQSQGFYGKAPTNNLDLFAQLFFRDVEADNLPTPLPDPVEVKPTPTPPAAKPAKPPQSNKPKQQSNKPSGPVTETSCLRCIYGGFVISGTSHCKPVKNIEGKPVLHNQGKMNFPEGLNSSKFACTGGDVLCNPMLYGWATNNKPFCISQGKNASHSCGVAVGSDPDAFKRAKSLIDLNPKSFEKLKLGLQQICKSENLCKRSQNRNSKKDISETCEAIRVTIEDFKVKSGLTADQAPKIEPAKSGVE